MYCRNPQCRTWLDRRRTYFYCPKCGWKAPRSVTQRVVKAVSRTIWNIQRRQMGVISTTGERYFRQAGQALRRRRRVAYMNVAPFRPVNYGKLHPDDAAILRSMLLGFLVMAATLACGIVIFMLLGGN